MSPLDPQNAPFRCWEHEDCLEHPELAIACAGGMRTTTLSMFDIYVYDGAIDDVSAGDILAGSVVYPGDGAGGWYGTAGDATGFPYLLDREREEYVSAQPEHGNLTEWHLALTDYELVLIREGMM